MGTYKKLSLKTKILISLFLLFIVGFLAYSTLAATQPEWTTSSQLSPTELELNWNPVSGATGYNIYRSTDTEFQKQLVTINDGATTSYIDTTISELVIYHYEITAIINGAESEFSAPLTVRTDDLTNPSEVTISSPQNGGNWVELSWSAPLDPDIDQYEIFRNSTKVGVIDGVLQSLTYRDIGLQENTSYNYYVIAVDNSGLRSVNSNTLNVVTGFLASSQKFSDEFINGNNWSISGNNTAIVSFTGSQAKWEFASRYVTRSANIDLKDTLPPAFTISDGELNATLSFWWSFNAQDGDGSQYVLTGRYKEINDLTWANINSISQTFNNPGSPVAANGTESWNLTFPSAGTYQLQFFVELRSPDDSGDNMVTFLLDDVNVSVPIAAPNTPTGLELSKIDNTKVELTWNANSDSVIGYQILRSTGGDITEMYSVYATTNTNTFTDPDVPPGNVYHYRIVALNDAGMESAQSNTVLVDNLEGQIDITSPDQPTYLTASSVSSTKIDLVWGKSIATDVDYYIVWMSHNGGTYTNVGQTSSPSHRIDVGLVSGDQYTFRAMAVDTSGNYSAASNHYSVIVPEPDLEPPTAPTSLEASSIGESFLELTWTISTDNVQVERYEVELLVEGIYQKQKEVMHPNNKVVVDKLKPNMEYVFQVIAYDTSENPSEPSNTLTVTTLADTTPPKVLLKKPYEGATGIGTHESVLIKFDEEIDPATVTNETFFVAKTDDSSAVLGDISFSSSDQIKFSHQGLLANTEYTITLLNTISNVSGLQLEQTISWNFTTGSSQFQQPHGDYSKNTALCKTCHNAHQGEREKLINSKTVYELCYLCHDGTGSIYNIKSEFGTPTTAKQSLHPIFAPSKEEGVEINCANCHDTHDAGIDLDTGMALPSIPKLITSTNKGFDGEDPIIAITGNQFCWNCHGNTETPHYSFGYLDDYDKDGVNKLTTTTVRVTSSVTMQVNTYFTNHQTYYPANDKGHNSSKMDPSSGTDIQCMTCHEKHGSDVAPLLRTNIGGNSTDKNGKEFCYQCHQVKVDTAYSDWKTHANEDSYDGMAVNELSGHAQFDCQVCHNQHGTENPNYLRLPYRMNTSKVTYSASDNALCFDCHDESKLRSMGARQRGDRENLHDFHLRGSGVQATCKSCHRPHGAIATEQRTSTDVNHKVGFPNNTVSGSRQFDYNGEGSNTGACALDCHGQEHRYGSNEWYGGALRNSGNSNNWALKDNWKTESWLLNNRPEVYKNGPGGTHWRDDNNDGFHWK